MNPKIGQRWHWKSLANFIGEITSINTGNYCGMKIVKDFNSQDYSRIYPEEHYFIDEKSCWKYLKNQDSVNSSVS